MRYRVTFEPSGKIANVLAGTTLLAAAQSAGVYVENTCGGRGTCGKCRIKITSAIMPPTTSEERKFLSSDDINAGWRLACDVAINSDMVVTARDMNDSVILEKTAVRDLSFNPAVRIIKVALDPPSLDDARDDACRLLNALNMSDLSIDTTALQNLPHILRASNWHVAVLIWNDTRILKVMPESQACAYGIAIDLGTTTIAAYLCNLETGDLVEQSSTMNPQIAYGDDVISRLSICGEQPDGEEVLRRCLFSKLNTLIAAMASNAGISPTDISEAVIVGNTVMQHIVLGLDVEYLGRAPFIPATTNPVDVCAQSLGLGIFPAGNVHIFPAVGEFVGGDTSAALLSEQPFSTTATTMLIDIGTNSEICLVAKGRLLATSCATGPALEGAQISCGMRASSGAIDAVRIDPCTLKAHIRTIGDADNPVGICGSGIIDAVAQMALTGVIEPSGRFSQQNQSPYIRRNSQGEMEYVLYEGRHTTITITQKDVRAIQLAKSALYAGAQELLSRTDNPSIDHLILAGAFGSYLDPSNALALGLFPDCKLDNISVVGNAAGLGARIALLDATKRQEIFHYVAHACVIDTAIAPLFQKHFADAMAIPHAKDSFYRNRPSRWNCFPGNDEARLEDMLPSVSFAEARAYASDEILFPSGRIIPCYPYDSLDEIATQTSLLDSEAIKQTIESLANGAGRDTVVAVSGPMALLATLIDPTKLYTMGNDQKLDQTLSSLADAIAEFMIVSIKHGARVLSFGDAEGCVELVGTHFFQAHAGPALIACLQQVEPYLDHALIHLCGKTSASLTGTGYASIFPMRVSSETYLRALFDSASQKACRFIGNNCIHTQDFSTHLLYRLELN